MMNLSHHHCPLPIQCHNVSQDLEITSLNSFFFFCVSSYGSGNRIKLAYTRKIIDAIHSGALLTANYTKTEVFGLEIPTEIEGVPSEILDPANTVSPRVVILLTFIF